jgi:hypothetical protein
MRILDNTAAALTLARVGIDAGLPAPHTIMGCEGRSPMLILPSLDSVYVWAVFLDLDVKRRADGREDGDVVEFADVFTEWDGTRIQITANQRVKKAAA